MNSTLKGLRLWLWTLFRKPSSIVLDNIEAVELRFDEIREHLYLTAQRRVRRFELKAIAWGATAVLLTTSCVFLLMGSWLELSRLLGPVQASFLLALLLGALACVPLVLLAKMLARDNRSDTWHHK